MSAYFIWAHLKTCHTLYALSECVSLQLPTENQEVWEESVQCLSLLVQLYAGEGHDCLSPSGLQSLSQMLRVHMQAETPRTQRTALKIIKRLVSETSSLEIWPHEVNNAGWRCWNNNRTWTALLVCCQKNNFHHNQTDMEGEIYGFVFFCHSLSVSNFL